MNSHRLKAGRTAGEVSMASRVQALILSRPGPLRDALKTLLASIPGMMVLAGGSVTSLPRAPARAEPDLVLMDADLYGDEEWAALREIKDQWPRARFVLLTDDGRMLPDGHAAQADAVLMKGMPAAKLVGVLERLVLVVHEQEGEDNDGGQAEA
jgi:DNA-binding NarL/FixJ family response regulator